MGRRQLNQQVIAMLDSSCDSNHALSQITCNIVIELQHEADSSSRQCAMKTNDKIQLQVSVVNYSRKWCNSVLACLCETRF